MWMYRSAFAGSPISSSMARTSSLAPPCRGPFRVPIAATMAECRSVKVAMATRVANVLALISWSACRMKIMSIVRAATGEGGLPVRTYRKFSAVGPSVRGLTGSRPCRR